MVSPLSSELAILEKNRQVFGVMLSLHGGVHLFGWIISWQMFEVQNFRYEDVWPTPGTAPAWIAGTLWAVAGLAIGLVGIRFAVRRHVTQLALALPLVLSVGITLTALPAALPGTVISATVLGSMGYLSLRRRQLAERRHDAEV